MAQIAVEHAEEAASTHANPAPLGLGAFGLTTFVLSVANASFVGSSTTVLGASDRSFLGLTIFGGIALLIAGMWEFRSKNTLNATAFTLYGAMWLAYGYGVVTNTFSTEAGLGYFFLAWAILSFVLLIGSLRTNLALIAVFLLFTLTTLAISIGRFTDSSNWHHIGGWLGVITAIIAGYATLASLLHSEKSAFQLPTFPMS